MDLDKWIADLNAWINARLKGELLPLTLPVEEQDLYGLTLGKAIDSHEAWLHKLELTLRGQNPEDYDADVLTADHICTMGKWLYGEGRALEKLEEYETLKADHQSFHKCAGNIVDLHKRGRFSEAIKLLRIDLIEHSRKVETDLIRLQIKVWRLKSARS